MHIEKNAEVSILESLFNCKWEEYQHEVSSKAIVELLCISCSRVSIIYETLNLVILLYFRVSEKLIQIAGSLQMKDSLEVKSIY